MADAIVKANWRRSDNGSILNGPMNHSIGGTCFTLESGITLSSAHGIAEAFSKPADSFDDFGIWIIEPTGRVTKVSPQQFRLFPEWDAAIIDGYRSTSRYAVSKKAAQDTHRCDLIGYKFGTAPYYLTISPNGQEIEIYGAQILNAEQRLRGLNTKRITWQFTSDDVKLSSKEGFVVEAKARKGLSGGPMIDAEDGGAVGFCSFGMPQDAIKKRIIGVVDIRHLPLANWALEAKP